MKQANKSRISDQQRSDWLENPCTIEFRGIIQESLKECLGDKGIESYHRGEPHKTQEALAEISGAIEAFDIVIEALGGQNESSREDSGTEEQIWGVPGSEQGVSEA